MDARIAITSIQAQFQPWGQGQGFKGGGFDHHHGTIGQPALTHQDGQDPRGDVLAIGRVQEDQLAGLRGGGIFKISARMR